MCYVIVIVIVGRLGTIPRQRRGCGYNAFQKQEMKGCKMRVGSAEHKSFQNDLSTRWSQMSAESKAVFAAQAHDEMQAKKAVAGKLLRFSGEHAKLSTSQSKHLGQQRLDLSLSAIAGHPSWSHGLGLASHVSALKPGHVQDISAETAKEKILGAFGYNPECPDSAE